MQSKAVSTRSKQQANSRQNGLTEQAGRGRARLRSAPTMSGALSTAHSAKCAAASARLSSFPWGPICRPPCSLALASVCAWDLPQTDMRSCLGQAWAKAARATEHG